MQTISIIVCTWNRAESLRASLTTLERQVLPNNVSVEVIVVDNNSSDETAAVVHALTTNWQLGTLRYLFEGRQGKQFALNAGISASTGMLLAFTDDDIVFPAEWIKNFVHVFEEPGVSLAGGKTLIGWENVKKPAWYNDGMMAVLAGVDCGEERMMPPPDGYAPAGSNMIARRTLFAEVGMFSESHFRHMDYEFGLRCARQRVGVAYEPSLLVWAPVDDAILNRRYFQRWAFKAGIVHESADDNVARLLLYAPRWVYGQIIKDIIALLINRVRVASIDRRFTIELRIWRAWATLTSCWYRRLWPDRYPLWVARHSQKKKNLY